MMSPAAGGAALPERDARMHPCVLSRRNKLARLVWRSVWIVLFRPSPRGLHPWRRLLLRLFGATMGARTHVYPSAQIWAPWNLSMQDGACLGHFVDCYNVAPVVLGRGATVSQYGKLLTASHDYGDLAMPLIAAPIHIGEYAWLTADVLVCPGAHIGAGAVVLAGSVVTRPVGAWEVVAGNPARFVKKRGVRPRPDA